MTPARLARAEISLRGLAVGDAFGACAAADPVVATTDPLPPGPWLWTDDTEMASSIVDILARFGRIDQDALATSFVTHYDIYRRYGPGTNRILRLIRAGRGTWRDLAPQARNGQGSWGNGAAMRVAPLGAFFADDLDRVIAEAAASAEVTHTHPEGIAGAIAVAVAAAGAATTASSGEEWLTHVIDSTPDGTVRRGIRHAVHLLTTADPHLAASELGNGAQTSAADTVPFCLWAAAQHPTDFAAALRTAAATGGDTDTLCAIIGGILATRTPPPQEWTTRCEPLPAWLARPA
ncbi:ADP-ribosylglycohydrolase family protein [Nocardia sp. NPDC057663]|uniref:ADP-ribosylglycohydrolase family protein n=1 Tax=Nocardia sp. NPDC057663 TaxID=3346201 RepID=UPI00366E01C2